ncbi:MAG TPA: hypothetical protein VNE86_03085 [Nitrososphaerales archaeon]|nr:hypothetical protein [Nitrososphaerales archaeon]
MQIKIIDNAGKEIGSLDLDTRDENNPFSSGSLGFFAGGKILLGVNGRSKTYQASCSFVEINTKDPARAEQAAKRKKEKLERRGSERQI